ncbi:MAG TPA: hypothetical protein VFI73_11635, partial [Candidatus Nitrosopolaris sp.]|nr:hypothetical protein [Candidatus Nitrosopolaris sp.]
MPTNTVVVGVACFLTVVVILSLYSIPSVSAKSSKGPIACSPSGLTRGGEGSTIKQVRCCQTSTDSEGITVTYCTYCDDTDPPSNCGPRFIAHGGGNTTVGPTQTGNGLPNTGAIPNGQTGQPDHLGTALPSSGNNTGTLPVNNNTGTLPPGSIIKVPPGT